MLLSSLVFARSSWISLSFLPLSLHWLFFFGIALARVHFSQLTAHTTGVVISQVYKVPWHRILLELLGSSLGTNPQIYPRLQKVTRNSQWPQGDFFPFQAASQVSRSSVTSLLNWCCWAMEICYLLKHRWHRNSLQILLDLNSCAVSLPGDMAVSIIEAWEKLLWVFSEMLFSMKLFSGLRKWCKLFFV